jgi:hypothetical protein
LPGVALKCNTHFRKNTFNGVVLSMYFRHRKSLLPPAPLFQRREEKDTAPCGFWG